MAGQADESSERESCESEEEDEDGWEDWARSGADGKESIQCLFCPEMRSSAASVFEHSHEQHSFDFVKLRRDHGLKFYDCLRLINYIRSQVAEKGSRQALEALLQHVESRTSSSGSGNGRLDGDGEFGAPWDDEKYLTPILDNDALLYTFDDGEESEDLDAVDVGAGPVEDHSQSHKEGSVARRDYELEASDLSEDFREVILATPPEIAAHASALLAEEMSTEGAPDLEEEVFSDGDTALDNGNVKPFDRAQKRGDLVGILANNDSGEHPVPRKKKKGRVTFSTVAEKEKLSINRSYFSSYSGFGIHREMLGDRVRTEAYQTAIVENPSLLRDSLVMDVGCGTGILSLFAAKAGARRVVAVDGSEKMTAVATQVAKVNGFLDESVGNEEQRTDKGVMIVVAGMIEELDKTMPVQENSVDVLVSEWMGYCLLFESMLGSVLYARDKWLKPGGAMLPDTASMYVAGFGKGGTSLSFWENVYGFDMQCVGEEVVHDATQHPIIDVIPSKDVITETCLLKEFDLTSMKHSDVDYTADFSVKLLPSALVNQPEDTNGNTEAQQSPPLEKSKIKCYGLVVWFDTGFTDRFCKEKPVNLSTSPHKVKTHWSQTLLTFKTPVTLCMEENVLNQHLESSLIGSDEFPAYCITGRMSIARSFRHRSIDISLETTAIGADGAVKSWPVQMFDI